jgi:hypothetical protein
MAMIEQGRREARRVNLIDVVVAVLLLVCVPVAYGAYLLFRPPAPKLVSVEPARLYQGPDLRVVINGQNLRPYLRVSFNTIQGRTFLIGNTKFAEVDLPKLDPGVYDIVLFDVERELDRLKQVLTIMPLAPIPVIEMEVTGSFKQLPDAVAKELKVGTSFPPTGAAAAQILALGPRRPASLRLRAGDAVIALPTLDFELPATLKVRCFTQQNPDGTLRCSMESPGVVATVAPDSTLTLAGPRGWVTFQIDSVHIPTPPSVARARVRFVAAPEIVSRMKPGDLDADPRAGSSERAAAIESIGASRAAPSSELSPFAAAAGERAVDVVLRVPVEARRGVWTYKDQPLRAGDPFTFATATYSAKGEIADVTAPASPAAVPHP